MFEAAVPSLEKNSECGFELLCMCVSVFCALEGLPETIQRFEPTLKQTKVLDRDAVHRAHL